MPLRKEVRFFTRGEFTLSALEAEPASDPLNPQQQHRSPHTEYKLSEHTSLYGFTHAFSHAIDSIKRRPEQVITIDGGPHTFWWPTQSPDGSLQPADIPPLHVIRELQPTAPLIITLTDPVRRTYSDYYFLLDNLQVNRGQLKTQTHRRHHLQAASQEEREAEGREGEEVEDVKSIQQFHERMKEQIESFNKCIEKVSLTLPSSPTSSSAAAAAAGGKRSVTGVWFRASQM